MNKDLYAQLMHSLRSFNLNELNEHAINQIQDLNWDDIVADNRMKSNILTRNVIINIILEKVKELEVDDDILQEYIINLNLLACGLSKTKIWQTYKLLEQISKIPTTVQEIKTKLQRKLRSANSQTELNSIDHDGEFVISISKITSRNRSANTRMSPPIFLKFRPNLNYVFSTKVLTDENFMQTLSKGLGYDSLKSVDLRGRNVESLIKTLLYKDDLHNRISYTEPLYKPKFKTTASVVDFTRTQEKTEYADEIYDENINLQGLTINLLNKPCITKGLKGEKLSASLVLKSPNITTMLKNLIEQGVIETPVPQYLKDALKHGKNILNIGSNR